MFTHPFDLKMQRTAVQAIGLFLVYFAIGVGLSFLLGASVSLVDKNFNTSKGIVLGTIVATIICPILYWVMLVQKKKANEVGWIILGAFVIPISFLVGALGGLIPTAILSTKAAKE